MQPLLIEVRFPFRDGDAVDAALAERLTTAALFVPFRLAPVEVDIGTWVRVVIVLDDGSVALVVDGVAAWRQPEGAVPTGLEAGLGVAIVAVDAAHQTRFASLVGRAGAGTRARVPGQRLLLRQRLPGQPLPTLPSRPPAWTHDAVSPTASSPALRLPLGDDPATGGRLALLAHMLASADADVTIDGESSPPSSTENPSSSPAGSSEPRSPFVDVAMAPAAGRAILDGAAPPFALPAEHAFDRRSTDVDLLASVSAQHLVSLDDPSTVVPGDGSDTDLPSLDGEFVQDVADDVAAVMGTGARPLPAPERADSAVPGAPCGILGVAFTLGPRGLTAVEPVAWAASGSKRAGAIPLAEVDSDTGAFAVPARSPDDDDNPFAPRVTDPAVVVDDLVARAIAAARDGDVDSDRVFGALARDVDTPATDGDVRASNEADRDRRAARDDTDEGRPA